MAGPVLIHCTSADGEEREEQWPSVEAFRCWAMIQPTRCRFTAYLQDEDGEWVVAQTGTVDGTTA